MTATEDPRAAPTEADSGAGRPAVPRRTIVLLSLCAIVSHSLARSTYPILLPAIESELLRNHAQAGSLSTVNFGAYLAGVAVVTALSGRLEPIRVLYGGLALAVAGFAVLSQAGSYAQLAAGLALAGMASAAIWNSTPVIAAGLVGPQRRGLVMGLLSSFMGLGIVAASQGTNLVRSLAHDDQVWRPIWVGAASFAALLLVLMGLFLRPPATSRVSGGFSLARLKLVPGWKMLTASYLLSGLSVSSFTPFFGVALEEHGFSRHHVANLYSLFGLAAALTAVNLGRVSDRIGRRPVLLGAQAVVAGAALLVVTGTEPFATIAAMAFGAASFTFPVLVAAYLSDYLHGRELSNALGALTLLYGIALTAGPFLSGSVGDSSIGFNGVFTGVAAVSVAGALFISRLPRVGRPRLLDGNHPDVNREEVNR